MSRWGESRPFERTAPSLTGAAVAIIVGLLTAIVTALILTTVLYDVLADVLRAFERLGL